MKTPQFVYEHFLNSDVTRNPSILLVEKAIYSAEKVVESLVDVFGWSRSRIHLRASKHDVDKFHPGWTQLSVVTYGVLWKWLSPDHNLMQRYNASIFDEWADLSPKLSQMLTTVANMIDQGFLGNDFRLVLMSAALEWIELENVFGGKAGLLSVTGRKHTMERCVVSPMNKDGLLDVAASLALNAVCRGGKRRADCMVFLPGIQEIISVQKKVLEAKIPDLRIVLLHSDCLDDEDEEELDDSYDVSCKQIVLATTIAARSVTLPSIRYVFFASCSA